jgi:transcriptional regulator with XRE-family HTH domain
LAHRSGLAPNFISLLERGKRGATIDTVWVLAAHLGVRPSEMVALIEIELLASEEVASSQSEER